MGSLLTQMLNFLSIELTVLLTAALPVIELRGAIPVGLSLGMSPLHAVGVSLAGSMIPVPIILLAGRPIFNYLRSTRLLRELMHKLMVRTLNNSGNKIQKYGALGLVLFVAIPLPGTGVWSASLAAALLDIRFKWAFPAILAGNILAALAVALLSGGVLAVFS